MERVHPAADLQALFYKLSQGEARGQLVTAAAPSQRLPDLLGAHAGLGTGAPNIGHDDEEPVLWPSHMGFDDEL